MIYIIKFLNHFFSFFFPVSSDNPSTSIIIATPANIHLRGGCLVFNWAVKTYVDALSSVLYAGHWYTVLSYFPSGGNGSALQYTTGITENISFGLDYSM